MMRRLTAFMPSPWGFAPLVIGLLVWQTRTARAIAEFSAAIAVVDRNRATRAKRRAAARG